MRQTTRITTRDLEKDIIIMRVEASKIFFRVIYVCR